MRRKQPSANATITLCHQACFYRVPLYTVFLASLLAGGPRPPAGGRNLHLPAQQEEVASLKREVGRLHDDRLAASQPRSMATSGGTVLALALGGSSDVIGALAWARACGYERLVLVQPGSPTRGTASASLELQPVQPAAPGTPAPGGSFFDNGSMVAYLLSLDAEHMVAGYYLVQPKDDGGGKGFSRASLEHTAAALVQVLATHKCSALVGLDFGGDVALPEEDTQRSG
jgi:hypothetical protein